MVKTENNKEEKYLNWNKDLIKIQAKWKTKTEREREKKKKEEPFLLKYKKYKNSLDIFLWRFHCFLFGWCNWNKKKRKNNKIKNKIKNKNENKNSKIQSKYNKILLAFNVLNQVK